MAETRARRKPLVEPIREDELAPVPIVRARDNLGELANEAGYGKKRIPLTRRGKTIAALVGLKDLQFLRDAKGAA